MAGADDEDVELVNQLSHTWPAKRLIGFLRQIYRIPIASRSEGSEDMASSFFLSPHAISWVAGALLLVFSDPRAEASMPWINGNGSRYWVGLYDRLGIVVFDPSDQAMGENDKAAVSVSDYKPLMAAEALANKWGVPMPRTQPNPRAELAMPRVRLFIVGQRRTGRFLSRIARSRIHVDAWGNPDGVTRQQAQQAVAEYLAFLAAGPRPLVGPKATAPGACGLHLASAPENPLGLGATEPKNKLPDHLHPFTFGCSTSIFPQEEYEVLAKYGNWMAALAEGAIQPETEAQQHFRAVDRGDADANTCWERAWVRLKERRAYEQEVQVPLSPSPKAEDWGIVEWDMDRWW